MTFGRLVAAEIKKLGRSQVFWVAPIVLTVYMALMLFGFEVYAAKNGVDPVGAGSLNGQMTGSMVLSAYSTVRKMAFNIMGLSKESQYKTELGASGNGELAEIPIEDWKNTPGTIGVFDFWGTFFKNLAKPKPFPKPDCNCPCGPQKDALPTGVPDQGSAGQPSAGLSNFFIGVAYGQENPVPAVSILPPPSDEPSASFMERFKNRLFWLTESVPLERKLIDRSRFNGMRFTYLSLYFSLVFIFPLIVVTVAAKIFAGEISQGTMRTSLLMPIRRSHLLGAKVLVLAGYLFGLILVFTICTLVVGVLFAGYGNLVLESDMLGIRGGGKLLLADGAVMLFLLVVPVAVISFLPLAFFAALLSFAKADASYVIGITSVGYLILFTLGGLPLFEEIRFLFLTTYMDPWLLLFDTPFNAGGFAFKFTVIGLVGGGILGAVNNVFLERDVYE